MADDIIGPFTAGFRLVWRRWGLLCWVFAANVALGALGTLPAARQLHNVLRHTLAGEQLFKGFDVGMFYELVRVPDAGVLRFTNSSYVLAGLFPLFMLIVSGGILEAYRQDRRLSTGEFFAVAGAFLWRFVRLALISLVLFAFLGNAYLAVEKSADHLGNKVTADLVGFAIWLVGVIILVLLALFVRLWFDLAKVRTVAQNYRRMLLNTLQALDIVRPQLAALLWLYLRISLVAWITALIAFLIWLAVPPTAVWATFLLLELVVLVQLGARLWQMASLTVWYKRYGTESAPPENEVIEPEPPLALYPETELPPTDA
jgi:hypothetical protein